MTFISKEELSLAEQRLVSLTTQFEEAVLEAKQMRLKLMTLKNFQDSKSELCTKVPFNGLTTCR